MRVRYWRGHTIIQVYNTCLQATFDEIVSLKKTGKSLRGNFKFVGPVCESSDKFSVLKNFSLIKEGDYIALENVGAYGMSLSSNYNTRPSIAEIIISGSKHKIIRKRQSLESLVNN